MRVAGVKMYAVGVGSAVESELKAIASDPIAEHYFYTADFKTMNQISKKLQINVCGEKFSLNPNFIKTSLFAPTGKLKLQLVVIFSPTEDPCECDSLVKFQKKVEAALQALNKKYIL